VDGDDSDGEGAAALAARLLGGKLKWQ